MVLQHDNNSLDEQSTHVQNGHFIFIPPGIQMQKLDDKLKRAIFTLG
jgi:hypothetical protein